MKESLASQELKFYIEWNVLFKIKNLNVSIIMLSTEQTF